MKVYYNKAWGIFFVIMSLIILVLHLYLINLTGRTQPLNMLSAILILVVGILYLNRPYFELTSTEIQLYAPLGYVVRRYNFTSYSDLDWDGKKLYLIQDGKRKRIRVSAMMSNKAQWQQFLQAIQGDDLIKELHDVD